MTYQDSSRFPAHRSHWQDWANLILAIWLFLSPWVLQFGGQSAEIASLNASWNAWILGVAVFVVSLGGMSMEKPWPEWINIVLGAWIFLAPWILGFAMLPAAAWDHWLVGAAIAVLGFWSASSADIPRMQSRT